ncbi:MAG: hypothetical protein Q9171_004623 [Xanthocarpia ochracea]
MEPAKGKYTPQSYYPIHPAALDGCLQTVVPSNASCERTNVKAVMIPALINDIIINKVPTGLREGRSKATSVYGGRGRKDVEKSWVANTTVWDAETGQLAMRITGLNYAKLDVAPKPDPHTFHSITWKPDIMHFTQDQIMYLTSQKGSTKLDTVLDMIAHKKPALKVLEINLDDTDTSSLWFDASDFSARAAYSQYDFASPNAKTLVTVEAASKENESASFLPISVDKEALGVAAEAVYDLAIIKAIEKTSTSSLDELTENIQPLLSDGAFTLLVRLVDEVPAAAIGSESDDGFEKVNRLPSPKTPGTPSEASDSPEEGASSITSVSSDDGSFKKPLDFRRFDSSGFSSVIEIAGTASSNLAYLSKSTPTSPVTDSRNRLVVVRLAESTPEILPPSLEAVLKASGWTNTQQTIFHPQSHQRIRSLDPRRAVEPCANPNRPEAMGHH